MFSRVELSAYDVHLLKETLQISSSSNCQPLALGFGQLAGAIDLGELEFDLRFQSPPAICGINQTGENLLIKIDFRYVPLRRIRCCGESDDFIVVGWQGVAKRGGEEGDQCSERC